MILFLVGVVLKPGLLKTTLLLNSVFVGMMGNLIVLKNFSVWSQTYDPNDILLTNFLGHTLPMFLSFLLLFGCPPRNGDSMKIQLLLSSLFLLWAAVPRNGMSMSEKVFDSYRMQIGVLVVMASLLTASSCKAIEYIRG
jgi:hypothetical protein